MAEGYLVPAHGRMGPGEGRRLCKKLAAPDPVVSRGNTERVTPPEAVSTS
jgi:hypothetical protein